MSEPTSQPTSQATANLEAWRALVSKELAGAGFDKLVQKTPEGVAIEPLYTERPAEAACVRGEVAAEAWRLCVRVAPGADVAAELDGGAGAVWCADGDPSATAALIEAARARGAVVVTDGDPDVVSTLAFHDAGADAADELALGLSSLVAILRRCGDAAELGRVAARLSARVAVGRDTFGELCKLRALRVCWHKVLAAAGVEGGRLAVIHAVCSSRTLSQRDPWVNMLRVTTQVFAAALGGAQLITPQAFDAGLAAQTPLGQRVARNTALVLREESQLGRVADAAGGSYYIETRTDALAREAWARFQAIERDGGVEELSRSGKLQARLEAAWAARAAAIAKRKEPVLGVSEFANLREQLPAAPRAATGGHRDSEAFEALRAKVEQAPRQVALVVLGPPAEHRARVGFSENLFAVAGVTATSIDAAEAITPTAPTAPAGPIDVACLCGSDERYAAEAADTARRLKAAGARRVVLAGRPGALEAELRAAGVDGFVFVGCDVLATLEDLLV